MLADVTAASPYLHLDWLSISKTMCQQIVEVATSLQLGELGSTEYFTNKQGLTLCRYYWPVKEPVGVVFCIHGFGSHSGSLLLKRDKPGDIGRYENSLTALFNLQRYSVACMDLQGCGRSDGHYGWRGFFLDYEDLVHDLVQFVHNCRNEKEGFSKELPTFLFGASMGGCLSVHVAHRCQNLFAGVALLAPMLAIEQIIRSGMNRYYWWIGSLLNYLIPDVPLVEIGKIDKFPEIQKFWDRDPAMYKGRMRVRVGYQLVKAIEWVHERSEQFNFPFIIVHGTEDTICDPQGSEKFFHVSKSEDKTLHMAQNMWHLLTAEPGHEKVMERVLEWFDARSSS